VKSQRIELIIEFAVENSELDRLGNAGGSHHALTLHAMCCQTCQIWWVICGSALLRYAKSCIQGIEELLEEQEDDSKPA